MRSAEGALLKNRRESQMQPRMPHSILWTWDGRMSWGAYPNHHNITDPDTYLQNYTNLIDFMAAHGIAAVVIWGFLRESHGGVDTARRLCDHAAAKGVRIIPGVGVRSYGGFCYESGRERVDGEAARWSLDQLLLARPEWRAVQADGSVRWWSHINGDLAPAQHCDACPSRLELRDWYLEGLDWLYRTFAIGGVWLEMGDNGLICQCPSCLARRGAQPDRGFGPLSYEDEALWMPVLAQHALNLAPDSWVILCQNLMYDSSMIADPPRLLSLMPHRTIVAWHVQDPAKIDPGLVLDDCDVAEAYAKQLPPPEPRCFGNVGVWSYGGCWLLWGMDGQAQHRHIAKAIKRGHQMGHSGICFYGELNDRAGMSGRKRQNEINYLAMSAFCSDPDLSIEEFEREHADYFRNASGRLVTGSGPYVIPK